MNQSMLIGRAIALAAAIFYGVNTTLSRLACDTGTTPVSLTLYRFPISAALMVMLLARAAAANHAGRALKPAGRCA